MAEERNHYQIARKDAKNCFVESLNDCFSIGRVHFAFAISLIKADLAYGLSGDEGTYDVGALEKSISDATTDLNDYMKQYNNTGGDKTKYIECIQQTSEKIRLLRIELDTAKAKISQNEKINQEVERLTKWLTEHDVSFESYDDVVVRRMVERIRVNNDNTITV